MRNEELTDSICMVVAIGVIGGILLQPVGEILQFKGGLLRIIGLVIGAPGALYNIMTGKSVYASPTTTILCFTVQIVYITVLTFTLIVITRIFKRWVSSQSITPD